VFEDFSFIIEIIENSSIDLLWIIYICKLNLYDLIDLTHNKKNEFNSHKIKIINKRGENYL